MLLALLLATFVVIPIAEMTLCAFESADAHSYLGAGDTGSGDDSSGYDDGPETCSHGHCHHTHAYVPAGSTTPVTSAYLAHRWADHDAGASRAPDGLKRPPKA